MRVGGFVTFQKTGQRVHTGLIEWINPDGTMRVRPHYGRRTIVHASDVMRAERRAARIAKRELAHR